MIEDYSGCLLCSACVPLSLCVQVEPFASLVTLPRHTVPRVLLNRELVGPFRSSRCRLTDVAVSGDMVESVRNSRRSREQSVKRLDYLRVHMHAFQCTYQDQQQANFIHMHLKNRQ